METLQAVHLLLALPLFVVVVGVDSRWLLRALEGALSRVLVRGVTPTERDPATDERRQAG